MHAHALAHTAFAQPPRRVEPRDGSCEVAQLGWVVGWPEPGLVVVHFSSSVVLYRVGDFYETFFEDAVTLAGVISRGFIA
jgi:hypothetical protein